jgi:two-component system sensor histidine kinase/response regulator
MKRTILTAVAWLATLITFSGKCQSIGQLSKDLEAASSDSARSDIWYAISTRYWNGNSDSVLSTAARAFTAARNVNYEKGMAQASVSEGVGFELKEEYPEALQCYLQALRICETLKMDKLKESIYVDLGNVYAQLKDYARSTGYYLSALRITEGDPNGKNKAILLIDLAETYKETGAYDSALAYNNRAWDIARSTQDSPVMSTILLNIGDNYNRRQQPENALVYLRKSGELASAIHDEQVYTWSRLTVAESLLLQHKYGEAVENAWVALTRARQSSFSEVVEKCYSVLYRSYRQWGKFEQALQYRNLEVAWNDSLNSLEKEKKFRTLQAEYELEKKQHDIDVLNKDNLLQQKELAGARQRNIIIAACALFFGMSAIFLYRSNKQKESLYKLLQAQSKRKITFEDPD